MLWPHLRKAMARMILALLPLFVFRFVGSSFCRSGLAWSNLIESHSRSYAKVGIAYCVRDAQCREKLSSAQRPIILWDGLNNASASSIIYQQTAVKLGTLRLVKVKEDSSPKTDHVIIVFTTICYMYFTQHHFKIVNLCVGMGITFGSNLLISNLDLYFQSIPFNFNEHHYNSTSNFLLSSMF